MSRSSRLALWSIALLFSLWLYGKGRIPAKSGGAAFFRAGPGNVIVRLAGDFPRPGLYLFPDGTTVSAAIKMTAPERAVPASSAAAPLSHGDIVTLHLGGAKGPVVSMGKMKAKERMLVGIALDPDLLEADEWDCLPGIGPVLAARIVADRHENGAFRSVDALLRVRGVGPAKVAALRKYFVKP